jgi:hypothetical protein
MKGRLTMKGTIPTHPSDEEKRTVDQQASENSRTLHKSISFHQQGVYKRPITQTYVDPNEKPASRDVEGDR